MSRNKFLFPALLVLFWVVNVLIVNPTGDFPLDDDWQYSRPVWYLVHNGYYLSTDSYSPIIMAQVFWGYLFCLPMGFSFMALRVSTLVLSLAGVILFYALLVRLIKNPKWAFLGALLLAANPLYIILSCTFMTDIPFLVFAMASIYFFFAHIESGKLWHVILATLSIMVAILIRQFALVIPIAYALAMMVRNKEKPLRWPLYAIPAIIAAVALQLGLEWLKSVNSELRPYRGVTLTEFLKKPDVIYAHSMDWGSHILAYTGFFLLPLLIIATWHALARISKRQKIVVFTFILFLLPVLFFCCKELFRGNMIHTYGIGPRTLMGMDDMVYPNPNFPIGWLWIIRAVAFAGAIMLLINLGKIIMDIVQAFIDKNITTSIIKQVFILLFFAGYAILIFIPDFFFDRYLLVFIPITVMLIFISMNDAGVSKLKGYVLYCIMAIGMGLLGSAMVHDYFEWNRTRWAATDYLRNELNISPHKIDGGYEFNSWVLDAEFPWNPNSLNRSWWDVDDDEYVVAFNNFKGYSIIRQMPYESYVPNEMKSIYILHRNKVQPLSEPLPLLRFLPHAKTKPVL